MNNVPQKLRERWAQEDIEKKKRICMRADERNCQGRLTKEHALYYAGKQIQEDWAILDICEFHHDVGPFQGIGDLNKEKHTWIALNRAPETRLRELSKAEDKIAVRDRLNIIYGLYKPLVIN